MKNFKILKNVLLVVLVLTASNTAHSQLEITISEGNVRGLPIAIVPFRVADGTNIEHQLDKVIGTNLRASGKFEPISSADFLSFPSRVEEVRYKDWRFIDAEALVIGEIWKLGVDNYEVQFRMFDVARQQEIGTGKRIPNLREKDLRVAAHIVSDHVYEAFTGRPGAYNSKMAFIKRSEIEFQRFRYRLMVADWDGYGETEVYGSWKPLLSPSWSPDGSKLAFVSFSDSGPVVQILELSTGNYEVIASFKGVNSAPSWSPDGNRVAYSTSRHGSPDVYIYDLRTGQHTRVTTHYGIDTEPSWSPDGNSLLFTSNRAGKPQIYTTDINSGGRSLRMTFEGKENANASYDFDAQRIVMVTEGGQIAVMDEENSKVTLLTNAKFDESPSFSPNGDMVLYASEQLGQPVIMVASSDGRVRTRLEFISGDVREPAWSSLK